MWVPQLVLLLFLLSFRNMSLGRSIAWMLWIWHAFLFLFPSCCVLCSHLAFMICHTLQHTIWNELKVTKVVMSFRSSQVPELLFDSRCGTTFSVKRVGLSASSWDKSYSQPKHPSPQRPQQTKGTKPKGKEGSETKRRKKWEKDKITWTVKGGNIGKEKRKSRGKMSKGRTLKYIKERK